MCIVKSCINLVVLIEKTIYNCIDKEIFLDITNKDLIEGKRVKKKYKKVRTRKKNLNATCISERPLEIEKREEYGHWEMDLVVGGRKKGKVLLVLSERKTRKELIFILKSKTQEEVVRVLKKLERKIGRVKFSNKFKSITVDNGSEFLDFESMEKSLFSKYKSKTKIYYAHPYSSYERGTNENLNKMIRRFIPKGTDIGLFDEKYIQMIEDYMNNYPRKILGGLSANAMEKLEMI